MRSPRRKPWEGVEAVQALGEGDRSTSRGRGPFASSRGSHAVCIYPQLALWATL